MVLRALSLHESSIFLCLLLNTNPYMVRMPVDLGYGYDKGDLLQPRGGGLEPAAIQWL